ncbi:hypothetical protein V8C37DRAFT_351606 [Trichoderma ceciliae]
MWPIHSSRVSSRCTNYEPRGTFCSTDSPLLSNSSLSERTEFVLSPHISVISETAGVLAGQQHLWAAVEVCGRLFPASGRPEHEMMPCPETDTSLKFGYLYDLTIDILPTPQSSIVQTICPQSFPT